MAESRIASETIKKWGLFPPADHLSHLQPQEAERYNRKIKELDVCDPYTAPVLLFNCLKTTNELPDLDFGDIWIYLVNNPSPYTAAEMKCYKATDSHKYAVSGWVNWPVIWTLNKANRSKFHIIKARVSTHFYAV